MISSLFGINHYLLAHFHPNTAKFMITMWHTMMTIIRGNKKETSKVRFNKKKAIKILCYTIYWWGKCFGVIFRFESTNINLFVLYLSIELSWFLSSSFQSIHRFSSVLLPWTTKICRLRIYIQENFGFFFVEIIKSLISSKRLFHSSEFSLIRLKKAKA